jgi:ankyrin repeat protein
MELRLIIRLPAAIKRTALWQHSTMDVLQPRLISRIVAQDLNLLSAAGVGRLDVVKSYFNEDGTRKAKTSQKQVQRAFLYACTWGQTNVVEFLLDKGVDLDTGGDGGQTPLHCAAIGGQLSTMKLLLKFNPQLELRNMYGGTVPRANTVVCCSRW